MVAPPPLAGAHRAGQAAIRRANLSLVLRTVCSADEPVSRADVAGRTGLTRATASLLADLLVRDGLVDELDRRSSAGRGRPATPLVPGAGAVALGLQVDTGLLAGRVLDLRGDVVAEELVPADVAGLGPDAALQQLGALAERLLAGLPAAARVLGAGLALPGVLDPAGRVLLHAPNLGWTDVEAGAPLAPHLPEGLALRLGNEADLAALAWAAPRPGRPGECADFLYVSGNVGIGGAVVRDGRVAAGSRGRGGEVGHVCVDPHGPRCACGSSGCLEQYAGRRALLHAAGLRLHDGLPVLLQRVEGGDAPAAAAVERAADALGIAVAGALNLLDLPTVVLGGDLAELAPVLVPPLRHRLRDRVLAASWSPPEVVVAPVAPAPAATGAALACLADVVADAGAFLLLTRPSDRRDSA